MKAKTLGAWKTVIIVSIVIIIGIGMLIYQDVTEKKEIRMNEALQAFIKIDDIAHEGLADKRKRREEYTSGSQEFKEIDSKYHNAKTIEDKFRRAKKMDTLLDKIDAYIHTSGGLQSEESKARDKKYHEINTLFDTLK